MRVFVTGATGFVGSFVVRELITGGHEVVGLSRSDAGAEALARAGAKVFRGDVNDLEALRDVAGAADGIIHTAFNHDAADPKRHSENDRKVIAALGAALAGTGRPLIVTSGTGLVQPAAGQPAVETDDHPTSAEVRIATDGAATAPAGRASSPREFHWIPVRERWSTSARADASRPVTTARLVVTAEAWPSPFRGSLPSILPSGAWRRP